MDQNVACLAVPPTTSKTAAGAWEARPTIPTVYAEP